MLESAVPVPPIYASWLNQVGRWFGLITQQAIRHGSFRGVPELKARISDFVEQYNHNNKPFRWVTTADFILEKGVARTAETVSGT